MKQLHHSFLPQIISALLALAIYRVYTEMLLPDELGKAMLVLGVIAFIDALISSSINQTVFYFASKNIYKHFFVKFLKKNVKYSLSLGFCFVLLVLILSNLYQESRFNYYLVLLLVLVGYLVIEPFKVSMFSLLNVETSRKIFGFQVILDALFNFCMIILFLKIESNWFNLLIGVLVARFLSLISNLLLLKNVFTRIEQSMFREMKSLKINELVKYMFPVSLMGLLGWVTGFADRFIIASSIGLADTGVYSLATGLTGRPFNVSTAALTAHFRPELYKNYSESNKTKFQKSFLLWLLSAIVIGFLGVVFFYFFGSYLVNILISESYREQTSKFLYLLAIAYTFNIVSHSIENKFLAMGKAKLLLFIQMVIVFLPIASIFVGGYFYGLAGAIYGKIFSEIGKTTILFVFTKYKKI